MNPLTKVKLINELNAREAELGVNEAVSWHAEYKDSAWIFIGGLPYELTEGDVICVFSQYGEVVNINLVRDKKTGKSKGFCFLCYEDQRSTVLAVDNFNGIKIKGRTIRVDHVANYRPPKDSDDLDEVTKTLHAKGCGVRTPPHSSSDSLSEDEDVPVKKPKAERSRPGRREPSSPAGRRPEEEAQPRVKIKKEKEDPGYERYAGGSQLPGGGGRAASRTRRDDEEEEEEEEGRRRRPEGRRGGETGSRERRPRGDGEADRSGDRHRRPERPERARSRERRHEERGSAGGSGRC